MNNRLIIYLTVFFLSTFLLQFAFNESKSDYLYTELQQSHTENGKYQRDGIMWFDRETEVPLNGCLLYTSPSPRDGLLARMPSSA